MQPGRGSAQHGGEASGELAVAPIGLGPVDPGAELPDRRALGLLAGLGAVAIVLATVFPEAPTGGAARLVGVLEIAASVLGFIAGTLAILRWRLDGRPPGWWLGLALVVLALPGAAQSSGPAAYATLTAAAGAVAFALVVAGARPTNPRPAPPRDVMATFGGLVVAFLVAAPLAAPGGAGSGPVLVVGIALLLLGVAARAAHRGRPWGDAWLVPTLAGVAAADGLVFFAGATGGGAIGAGIVRLAAMGLATAAVAASLVMAAAAGRHAALEAELRWHQEELRRRVAEEQFAETLHEVRSRVAAIEGGVKTLEPEAGSGVFADSRFPLAAALAAEFQRLRELVAARPSALDPQPFSLQEALEPVLTVAGASGWPVTWDLPAARVLGDAGATTQVVHCLVANAVRHAPGSPIEVRGRVVDDQVVVRVEDRGPGIPHDQISRIFERGVRGTGSSAMAGEGLGLAIARRLVREQGGDVWYEPRPGGGARFAVALPCFAGLASVDGAPAAACRPRALELVIPAVGTAR